MKYFKTYEGFKKDYMKKIDLKDFKKIKKGSKILYMGGPVEVLDNNGYVLKLKGKDGKTFMVNKSQFDHGGMIREGWGKAPNADKAMRDLKKKGSVNEAVYIPSNIEEFAKRKGILPLVKKIGRWAEKAGKRINGGTAIGKYYDTLILDLKHQGGEIRVNIDTDEVKLHGTVVTDPKSFKKALKESINEDMEGVKKDIMDHWYELYGEKFINKYPAVAKILKQRKNVDARELSRIWDETYGEDFKEKYPAMWDKLSK